MRPVLALFTYLAFCAAAAFGDEPTIKFSVEVEIPSIAVSEYHRPYVAVWIQNQDLHVNTNLAVWYQLERSKEGTGTKWLPDLRQWWRRSGRDLALPVDGLTGATRPPGVHTVKLFNDDARLRDLKPGSYVLMIEAVREVGGREVLQIPFDWPAKESFVGKVNGKSEVAQVALSIQP